MLALITAILAAAKPILDDVYFNNVMSYLNQYEDVLNKLDANLAQWPSIDDEERGMLKKEKARLEGALALQASLIQVKPA